MNSANNFIVFPLKLNSDYSNNTNKESSNHIFLLWETVYYSNMCLKIAKCNVNLIVFNYCVPIIRDHRGVDGSLLLTLQCSLRSKG